MTSLQKQAESKQLRENFVPSFSKSSFDLQVPKLDPSMARRLKEVKGGEASKAKAKEKALVASQYKILDIAKPLLYLWGSATSEATPYAAGNVPLLVSASESANQLWDKLSTASRSREERMCYARRTPVSYEPR
jgi:hypothetical protein